jgi:intracellular multiplication protein IcmP
MNRPLPHNNPDNTFIIAIVAIFLFFIMAGMFYSHHKRTINGCLVKYISLQLTLIEPVSDRTATIKYNLLNTDPEGITSRQFLALSNFTGLRLRWIFFPIALFLAGLVYFRLGRTGRFRRRFDMQMLLENNVKLFPALAPIVNRKRPITDEPMDVGPWRTARSPLQFAMENGLIVDENQKVVTWDQMMGADGLPKEEATMLRLDHGLVLDLAKTEYVFVTQLGNPFQGPEHLNNEIKGIAAALLAYGHSDRQTGIDVMNQLSLAFQELPEPGENPSLHFEDALALIKNYETNHNQLAQHASYTNCWLSALLEFARSKGVIACSMFIWLRPTDRTLWYALNQCGRRTAWPEAAGVRAHMQAEAKKGAAIETPQVEGAVIALEENLVKSGYIYSTVQLGKQN